MTLHLAPLEGADDEARFGSLAVLTQRVRDLVDAVVLTDVAEEELAEAGAELAALTERLSARRRATPLPHEFLPDGRHRHLGNAVTGGCNPHALPLVIDRPADGGSRAEITFRPTHEGPPGSVHGGVTAMIMDHLLGDAAAAAGNGGVTGTLTLRYLRPVPYGTPVVAAAKVARTEGRKAWVEGTISAPADGRVLVEATGLFITPTRWTVGDAG
ncbi:PaaI family thioesterase [Sphaerisporangium sp. TRM90804]|uniref:PaaI family thioesterase n=1 Tax=Sphaerisporangium sp. TRM90804 TaxID=3031113 RepID=UPI0024480054|nr:PaaI family thioesterase [Sphaerisporangium sp. TRM90804]MDH2425234.1 PaaI family thioesterase [Sphaerisporangium sp. TRM90804]